MKRLRLVWLLVGIVAAYASHVFAAEGPAVNSASRPLVSPVFGDNMVLQRGKQNTFWGWGTPGRTVEIAIGAENGKATIAEDGHWQLSMAVPAAGGPYTVEIASDQHVTLHNVMVGDVWLCGGQSNMALTLGNSRDGAAAVRAAQNPNIRLYTVAQRVAYQPTEAPVGAWSICSSDTVSGFSAVAYYFGQRLEAELHVPIGLIQDCVGGSPAESWMSAEALTSVGEFKPQLSEIERLHAQGVPELGSFLMHWLQAYDTGGKADAWAQPSLDDSAWTEINLPQGVERIPAINGPNVIWFRREFTIPENAPLSGARLLLGAIRKMDTSFLNGRWIGASSWSENPRKYPVPPEALHAGKNLVALRIFREKADMPFFSGPDALALELSSGKIIPLGGTWRMNVSAGENPKLPPPLDLENYATMPTSLFNGMIAPVAPLSIAGVIWYQGEANTSRAQQYRKLMPALINDWRAWFQQGEFPFYIVGLPAFTARKDKPGTDGWAELREVQFQAARAVRNAAVAVTIDTGDANNIHPIDKKPVGERLARLALAGHYGLPVVANGPILRSVEKTLGGLKVRFDHATDGLKVHDETLREFSVAGADRQWHWADARVEGDAVVVHSAEVTDPVAVRYGWQANPEATLFNGAGLPAAPFRTDDWP